MKGRIVTYCPGCNAILRPEAEFPEDNAKFITFDFTCPYCETTMIIRDPHKYDKDGFILASPNFYDK